MALLKLYPGAIYSHGATAYLVEELDVKNRVAWAVPRDPRTLDFYTECRDHTTVRVLNVAEAPWSVAKWAVALRFDNPRATVLMLLLG